MHNSKEFTEFSKGFQKVEDWEYYLTAWHGRSRFEKTKKLLNNEKVERILDIGCGNGFFLREIAAGAEKYGIDIVDIEKPNDFFYVQANLEHGFPFANESFDTLIAGEMIEHLLNTDNFVRECYRILEPGGCLIMTTPNLCSLKNLFLLIQGKQPIAVDFSVEEGVGHIRAFSPESLQRILGKAGFVIVGLYTDRLPIPFAPPKSEFFLKIEQRLSDIFRRWGNILVVKARKR
jgi:2-polyprenyl-3-methyl-5-hydroxy-6-metoxy-1,4-benzoquinol methylase